MDTSTVLHQCIIAVKPEDEFAFFEHSWTHAIPRLPHLNRAAISWVAYISSFQLSNGVRACTAIVAVLSFPSDREPANVPGSPAGGESTSTTYTKTHGRRKIHGAALCVASPVQRVVGRPLPALTLPNNAKTNRLLPFASFSQCVCG
jgi:hypothetical protein